ncbi:MAG TPA: GNAT family N-acetyltransferase [Oligoflexus sp.]|uniref:GNAT family N-acetyltransferase n=1 Tax=Oligoflexus sp. TaxID=1971216 RepID=UPI002D611888|nr:GNAT family N-acetyltransferase [Oligoflexus sp.]HYX37610.1 GNAT family N-acetyltransferase [Oligoflexus sp.]
MINELFPDVYQRDETQSFFKDQSSSEARKRYYEELGDFFVFRDESCGNRVMGMAAGTILDWSSYNFRNIAIHPDYQNLGLYPLFFDLLAEIMKSYGLKRIEGDVAPSNQHHLHVLNGMGCVVSSLGHASRAL